MIIMLVEDIAKDSIDIQRLLLKMKNGTCAVLRCEEPEGCTCNICFEQQTISAIDQRFTL